MVDTNRLTARTGNGLWDKAYEQVVEELMGMKPIDDKELLSYLLTHAQSFDLYDQLYKGKLPLAVRDAREFLKKMPFRPEYSMLHQTLARLAETATMKFLTEEFEDTNNKFMLAALEVSSEKELNEVKEMLIRLGAKHTNLAYKMFELERPDWPKVRAALNQEGFFAISAKTLVKKGFPYSLNVTGQGGVMAINLGRNSQ